ASQKANKAGLAYADLTQLRDSLGNQVLTAANIDALVGWRNNASAQPSGSFPSFSFNGTATTNYFNAVLGNQNGFMSTANTSPGLNGSSDQVFTSRQQLIDFFNNGLGAVNSAPLQNALQFLGTFSRDLNQPSYTPLSQTVAQGLGITPRPVITDADSQGLTYSANDSAGHDDDFNPAFLSVRVTKVFDRNAGSTPSEPPDMAILGEPLVKKRFPLNRLAWITYQGPSSTRAMTDPDMQALQNYGISATFLQQGTPQNISKYFGLTWNSANGGYWTYNHGINGSQGNLIIGYMSLIQAASREPDFFELLKATITAGSLGKGATNPNGPGQADKISSNPKGTNEESSAYTYDTTLDYQVLQIGANIIDQASTAGFANRIQFNNGTLIEVRGVKNLPYFYSIRSNTIISDLPLPHPTSTITGGTSGVAVGPDQWTSPASLIDAGCYEVLWQPEIWNPHAYNSAATLPSGGNGSLGYPRPTQFRTLIDSGQLDANGNIIGAYNSNLNRTYYYPSSTAGPDTNLDGSKWYSDVSVDLSKMSSNPSYLASTVDTYTIWEGAAAASSITTSATNPTIKTLTGNTALNFTDNGGALFREPTLLAKSNIPAGSNLALDPNNIMNKLFNSDASLSLYWNSTPGNTGLNCLNDIYSPGTISPNPYIGFFYGLGPMRWTYSFPQPTPAQAIPYVLTACFNVATTVGNTGYAGNTVRLQYNLNGTWVTYDQKYIPNIAQSQYMSVENTNQVDAFVNRAIGGEMWVGSVDPRTRRFGNPGAGTNGNLHAYSNYGYSTSNLPLNPPSAATAASASGISWWVDELNDVLTTDRWGTSSGWGWWSPLGAFGGTEDMPEVGGWYPNPHNNWMMTGSLPASAVYYRPGLLTQNNPDAYTDGLLWASQSDDATPEYFSDPDGVVRRATAAYVPVNGNTNPASTTVGLPMATTGGAAPATQNQSRPIVLNRPFRSVAELGCVFSDTPWRNLSMGTPESGAAPLLDVFCIQPDDSPSPMVAGKVDLNTRQAPVLQALLAGSYEDEFANENAGTAQALAPLAGGDPSSSEAALVAKALIARTTSTSAGQGPLANISELVGKWSGAQVNASLGGISGPKSYTGFSDDLTTIYGSTGSQNNPSKNNIERFREAALRPLASAGTVRVWNLLIDLVAQTGRFPPSAKSYSDFVVDGETRYWLHVAIDRQTGQVIDQQLEVVKE
ncbi:MAG TPA: hypothetical protein VGC39_00990, partial [Candidatus Methylacidiphilales bacterium]